MKMCAKCGGTMKNGGPTKSLPKAQNGQPVKSIKKHTLKKAAKNSDYNIQKGNWSFDKDGKIKTIKKMAKGGQAIVGMPGYNATTRPITMKKGGVTKNAKLAALAAPKNKITRADIITGAKRNAKKK